MNPLQAALAAIQTAVALEPAIASLISSAISALEGGGTATSEQLALIAQVRTILPEASQSQAVADILNSET